MSITQPDGYLALPSTGKGKAVLVLHPWWGLNDTIKKFCDRLAQAGFVAFAADLYHGKVTNQISEAEKLVSELDGKSDEAKADVAEAVKFLKARAEVEDSGMAVIGFSMGAFYALDLSAKDPETIRSVVLFYGAGPADFSKSKAEYLGHFAENDEYELPEYIIEMEESLQRAGRPVTFYKYSETEHWFFESDRDVYNEAAANLAWERTVAFLNRS